MRPYDPNLDDPNAQDTTQSSVQTGAVAPGQTGAIGASGAEPQAGASEHKTSGRWTNVNDYLNANRDSGLGGNLIGKVEGEVTGAKQTQANAGTEFGQRVNSATTVFDPTLVGRATTDSANFVSNANDVAAFKNQRDAEYKGLNNFSDASDLFSRAQGTTAKAAAKAGNLKSEGGRSQLLDSYFGRQGYNAGQKSLDGLVATSADPNAFAEGAARVGAGADSARSNLNQMAENLGTQASVARGTTENTRTQTRNALGTTATGERSGTGALGDFDTELKNQYDTAIADRDKRAGEQRTALGSAATRGDVLSRYGAGNPDILYKADPASFLKTADTTVGNYATAAQRARAKALTELSNLDSTYQSTADRPDELVSFDKDGFARSVKSGSDEYGQRRGDITIKQFNAQNAVRNARQDVENAADALRAAEDASRQGADIGGTAAQTKVQAQRALAEAQERFSAAQRNPFTSAESGNALNREFGVPEDEDGGGADWWKEYQPMGRNPYNRLPGLARD